MAHLPQGSFHPRSNAVLPTKRAIDLRNEEEIIKDVLACPPVTDEKNVWTFWDKGWDAMRPWVRRNVVDWVRKLSPAGWRVRVLDTVPGSPRNVTRYVDAKELPIAFGGMSGQHASDVVRVLLLHAYGGFWIDAGAILVRHLDDLWARIVDSEDPTQVVTMATGRKAIEDHPIANGFLGARKGNAFMRHWHTVFRALHDSGDRALVGHLVPFRPPPTWPVSEDDVETLRAYLAQWSAAGRLFALIDPASGWNGPEFFRKRLLVLSGDEMFLHSLLTNYDGAKQFALPSNERSHDEASGTVSSNIDSEAEEFVETLLARTTMVKFSGGVKTDPAFPQLAEFWNSEEHAGADCAPGTWAEYLRWGSVHLEQTRVLEGLPEEQMVARYAKRVWTAGILDVINETTTVVEA